MSSCFYRANIEHDSKTIQDLYRTNYYTYYKSRIILRFCAGLLMIIICVAANLALWAKGLLLLVGAWLVSTPDFMADKVLQARKNFPVMKYEFLDEFINISGEGSMKIYYKNLQKLIRDEKNYYIFTARDSVCMINKASLTPNEQKNFQDFISARTGLRWQENKFFLAMNLSDLREIFRADSNK